VSPNKKKEIDEIEPIEFVEQARVVTGPELLVGLGLVIFGFLPLLAIWIVVQKLTFQLENFIALALVGTYIFAVIETFAIIILWGLGRLYLPPKFVPWLGGVTIGEIAVLLTIVVKKTVPELTTAVLSIASISTQMGDQNRSAK
jgi:hypothetical protein